MNYFSLFLFLVLAPCYLSAQMTPTEDQYLSAGKSSYAVRNYTDALQYYRAAAQLSPNDFLAFQGIGNSQYMLGRKAEALSAYEKSLELRPDNVQLANFVKALRVQLYSNSDSAVKLTNDSRSSSKVEFDLMVGVDEPVIPSGYDLSFGGGGTVYFPLVSNIALGGSIQYYALGYQVGSGSASEVEGLAVLKLKLGSDGSNPYLLVGAGISDYADTIDGSVLNPVVGGGLGYEFKLGQSMNLFFEGRAIAIIASNTVILHVPIQAGIGFFL